jgi:hypothetical protein
MIVSQFEKRVRAWEALVILYVVPSSGVHSWAIVTGSRVSYALRAITMSLGNFGVFGLEPPNSCGPESWAVGWGYARLGAQTASATGTRGLMVVSMRLCR